MNRILVVGLAAFIGVVGVVTMVLLQVNRARSASLESAESTTGEIPPEALAMMVIPDFSLVDQNGAPATKDIFSGRMTLLAFSFTNCPVICPVIHSHLVRVTHDTLQRTPVRIVTISVDPTNDTPEALRAYAEKLGVESDQWSMLTGDATTIRSIVTSMRFAIEGDPSLPIMLKDGSTMQNILHPAKIALVGPQGTVIGLESGMDWESVERIAERARDLALRMGLKK